MGSKHMNTAVASLQSTIGYQCTKDPTLLWEALQAAGSPYHRAGTRALLDGNKKLAALGDAIADQWLWLHLYPTNCTKGQGDMLRQRLLCNENLARVGCGLGLETLMVMNPGTRMPSEYMVATMMEAIIGAVYLDGDMQAVESVMRSLGLEGALLAALQA